MLPDLVSKSYSLVPLSLWHSIVADDYLTTPGKAERLNGLDVGYSQPGMEINHALTHKQ